MNKLLFLFSMVFLACNQKHADNFTVSELMSNSSNGRYKLSTKGTFYSFINTQHHYQALYVHTTLNEYVDSNILINDTINEQSINDVIWVNDSVLVYSYTDVQDIISFKKKMLSQTNHK